MARIIDAEDLDVVIAGRAGEEPLRLSTAARGDIDGDGLADLIVPANYETWNDVEQAGTVRVYRGRKTWADHLDRDDFDLLVAGSETFQSLGQWFLVMDLDGDGRSDMVTSSAYHPDPLGGTVFVIFGEPAP